MIIEWHTHIYPPKEAADEPSLRVSGEDREKILWRNPAKLLKLDVQGVG